MNMRIIGIDLAVSAKHKAMILDPASNEFVGKQITFRARPEDLDRLLAHARRGIADDVRLVAVLEATSMAWYPVSVYLQRHGVTVYRVNGQKTKDLRRVLWKYAGSDLIDSCVLARLYLLDPARLEQCPLPTGDQLTLQRACRAYDRWRKRDVAEQNRMQAMDHWAWDGLSKLIPAEAQPWMRANWYDPWRVLAAGELHLVAAWQAEAPASPVDTTWIGRWVERATQMTTLYGKEEMVGYAALQSEMQASLALRAQYAQRMSSLMRDIIQPLYTKLFPNCPLTSIQGIGTQSAATYRAFIQDIERFGSAEKFRMWCGVVPHSKQSGQGESKGRQITQAGPNLIKATLYLNADVARQWDVQFAAIYHTQMVAYGKHHLKAVCACASHLANRIYAVLKADRAYELRDLEGNPISAEQSRELCQQYRVPEEVRQRNNKRFRRAQAEAKKQQKAARARKSRQQT